MDNTKQRKWVTLSTGVKVGLPTEEEIQWSKKMTRISANNHRLFMEVQELREKVEAKAQMYKK